MYAAIAPHLETELFRCTHPIKIGMRQACGVPVIAPGWLGEAGNRVLSYQNIQEGVDRILGLETDSKDIRYMRKKARSDI